jgi:L-rhamnose mutarotase
VTRAAFCLRVRPDMIEAYARAHEAVWPEMLEALHACGWRNYSLFLRDDGLLFGYVETPGGLDAARAAMAGRDVNTRWQSAMAPFFELPEGAAPDAAFIELVEVFHLD